MSTGFMIKRKVCKIGKREDKSDCAKKDCDNCRHWIDGEIWRDCMDCKHQCTDYPILIG